MKKAVFVLFLFAVTSVFAHLDAGEEVSVGEYVLDFGYSPKNPVDTDNVLFSFNLLNSTSYQLTSYDSLWLRISSDSEVVFSGTLVPVFGSTVLNYKFPYSGNFELTSRFINERKVLVEKTFTITIRKEQSRNHAIIAASVIFLSLILFLLYKTIKQKARKK